MSPANIISGPAESLTTTVLVTDFAGFLVGLALSVALYVIVYLPGTSVLIYGWSPDTVAKYLRFLSTLSVTSTPGSTHLSPIVNSTSATPPELWGFNLI